MDLLSYSPGRPPTAETIQVMERMVEEVKKDPGIRSAKLAKTLGIDSMKCAVLGKRLADRGIFVVEKDTSRALTYRLVEPANT